MALACRSATVISRRAVSSLPVALIPKSTMASAWSSLSGSLPPTTSRFGYVMGSLETMLPLHSAIASSRLKSNIAMDTTCWSWLSRDFAVPR